MKKIHSIILLFAFLVGAVQPIVPLLEYHFFKESIIELFCENRNVPESDCDGICYLNNQIEESRENQADMQPNHADYYPGYVLYGQTADLNLYPDNKQIIFGFLGLQSDQVAQIHTPPPRFS
jgi:hypothetical protein